MLGHFPLLHHVTLSWISFLVERRYAQRFSPGSDRSSLSIEKCDQSQEQVFENRRAERPPILSAALQEFCTRKHIISASRITFNTLKSTENMWSDFESSSELSLLEANLWSTYEVPYETLHMYFIGYTYEITYEIPYEFG